MIRGKLVISLRNLDKKLDQRDLNSKVYIQSLKVMSVENEVSMRTLKLEC